MKRLSPRERTLLGLLLVGIASVLVFLLILLPMRAEAGRLVRQLTTRKHDLEQAEMLYRSLPQLEKTAQEAQAEIADLSRPNENPTPDVIRAIEKLTRDQGVELAYIHPAEPEFLDTSTKYSTSFEVRAPLAKVVNLLYALEKGPHSLWVEGVDIGNERTADVLRATITVAVYSAHAAGKTGHAKS